MNFTEITKQSFLATSELLLSKLEGDEAINLNLSAEESLFVRFNGNKVRQNTHVEQRVLSLMMQKNKRTFSISFTLTGVIVEDTARALKFLEVARQECSQLPEDTFQVPLKNNGNSDQTLKGHLLADTDVIAAITTPATGVDLAGLYCAGSLISANRNSLGQFHWFANENFFVDYSVYMGEKAVKAVYAGTHWVQKDFESNLAQTVRQLELMNRPKITIQPGAYRTYLAPGAVAELTSMFSWGALSFTNFKQGNSALAKLAEKEKSLSPLFSMRENFEMGLTHRFNSLGELAPAQLDIIKEGQLLNFMISSRSEKEYGVKNNASDTYESPRAMEVLAGSLKESDILKELGTGLYLSNLHYLNWSDRPTARITGMTRYACFWVENGEIRGPIKDMRFDESLYDCLGENLLAVTDFQEIDPMVSTYESRNFGGKKVPGMLIKDFKFTL